MPTSRPEKPVSDLNSALMLPMEVVFTDHPDAEVCDTAMNGEGAYFLTKHRYARAAASIWVTLKQPLHRKRHRVITGRLLGELHVSGALHHYRVLATDGVVYLAPPAWLAPASRFAVVQAGLTVPKDPHIDLFPDTVVELGALSPQFCQ